MVFIIQTVAELFLSPVGLSTTSALAPKSFASQAMGLWWLSVATGQGVAGFVIAQTENASDCHRRASEDEEGDRREGLRLR